MRRMAVVVAALLLVVACSHEGSPTVDGPTTTASGVTTPGGQPAPTAPGGMPAPSPGATVAPGHPVTTVAPSRVPVASSDASGPPGSAAPLFLRPAPASALIVEISANDGVSPTRETLDHVTSVLHDVSGKPVSVTAGHPVPARDSWTAADLRHAADAAATSSQGEGHAVFRLLFLHGRWADSDSVLGISVRGDVAALFVDRIDEAADPLVGPTAIEVAATTHEVGHLLGLVDLYLNKNRDDPQHPGHSTDKNSVMYWAVESTVVTDLLSGGPPRDFDAADRADLAEIRGGA